MPFYSQYSTRQLANKSEIADSCESNENATHAEFYTYKYCLCIYIYVI